MVFKNSTVAMACFVFFACFTADASPRSIIWQKSSNGILESAVSLVAVHPHDASVIFVATDKALYRSSDGAGQFVAVFSPPGESQGINALYIDPDQPQDIYAATDAGLYFSPNSGTHWQRIYYSSDEAARKCLSLARFDDTIYLGTQRGLFYKATPEENWSPVSNELSGKPIYHIAHNKSFLYLTTDDTLYNLDRRTNSYTQVFTLEGRLLEDLPEEEAPEPLIYFARVTDSKDSAMYIATTRGIYLSDDDGQHWQSLTKPPVVLETLTAFVVLGKAPKRRFLVGTKRGAFLFEDGQWASLYQGMETNGVNDLAVNAHGRVYAAMDKGVFVLVREHGKVFSSFSSEEIFDNEPTIQQVHRWAIDYAEVDPEKIKSWRTAARKRAILPDLSIGLDRADGEYLHWDTGTNPDTLVKGRDFVNWDISLSWDLGDLVWNTDQTTIDSRSKAMVELREDVLDQVTRLYFERCRLQAELAALVEPGSAMLDKQLRVEELTALLDAFTGGKFSRKMAIQAVEEAMR